MQSVGHLIWIERSALVHVQGLWFEWKRAGRQRSFVIFPLREIGRNPVALAEVPDEFLKVLGAERIAYRIDGRATLSLTF